MKLAYFVHDVTEPAIRRRVAMLKAGGANIVVMGFRRDERAVEDIEGFPVVDLGRTYDARLAQRAGQVARAAFGAGRLTDHLRDVDVIMARSLEMLAVASAARRAARLRQPLIYECLDIHWTMLSRSAPGRILQALERRLLAGVGMLLVSSPAFLSQYFESRQGIGGKLNPQILVVENKPLRLDAGAIRRSPDKPPAPPWRIGWYGAVRCQRSLDLLTALAARRPDLLEVVIRGRPFWGGFRDFAAQVANAPNVTFAGPYVAADLPQLYGDVHFSWAVDYYEAGGNSDWLLPNRIYEAGYFGAPPIAVAGVETGRWLQRRGLGVLMDEPEHELETLLEGLTPDQYAALTQTLAAAPDAVFAADQGECEALVGALTALAR
jgi:succinoglycan biosynthesis protein ExoL